MWLFSKFFHFFENTKRKTITKIYFVTLHFKFNFQMKHQFWSLFIITLLLSSCNDNQKLRLEAQKKEAQRKEVIFANINKGWEFQNAPINDVAQNSLSYWSQWRTFMEELAQKPKSSITAFQKKSKILTKKALDLKENLPIQYNTPSIKSRIAILITNLSLLDMYLHLTQIPDKKVVRQIAEINLELIALQREMDKVDVKNKIPVEMGETEMLQMIKDTARAIPSSVTLPSNTSRVE